MSDNYRDNRCTHRLDDVSVLNINAQNLQRRAVSPLRPAAGSTEPSLICHLSVPETLSCFLFTFQSGDFFFLLSTAAPHCKRNIPACLFLYLFNHVAEAAIFWQMCHTGSWLCVGGYVTADEAVI